MRLYDGFTMGLIRVTCYEVDPQLPREKTRIINHGFTGWHIQVLKDCKVVSERIGFRTEYEALAELEKAG